MLEFIQNLEANSIINVVLGIFTIGGGGFIIKFKQKFGKVIKLFREVLDLLDVFEEAAQDDKFSKEELDKIIVEAKQVKVAALELFQKKQ